MENNNRILNELLNLEMKYIWVQGSPGSGKSYLARKIFETRTDFCRIFVGGCNPEFRSKIGNVLAKIISVLPMLVPTNKWLVILDEYDDQNSLSQIINMQSDNIYYMVFSNQECCCHYMKVHTIKLDNSMLEKLQLLNMLDYAAWLYVKDNYNIGKLIYLQKVCSSWNTKINKSEVKKIECEYLKQKREIDQQQRKMKNNLIICRCKETNLFFSAFIKEESD